MNNLIKTLTCKICQKSFNNRMSLHRHKVIHDPTKAVFACKICGKTFVRKDVLEKHYKVHTKHVALAKEVLKSKPNNKRKTGASGTTLEPPVKKRSQAGSTKQTDAIPSTLPEQDPIIMAEDFLPSDVDETVLKLYRDNWSLIRTKYNVSNRIQDRYNFRLSTLAPDVLLNLIKLLFDKQKHSFKINYSFGCVLRRLDSGELKYHYSCCNNGRAMPEPILVRNRKDLESVLATIENHDFLEQARQCRPDSKWIVELIPNLTVYINKLKEHPLGRPVCLPNYVLKNAGLVALLGDNHGYYKDKNCFFRCLALHKAGSSKLETTTAHLLNVYAQERQTDVSNFVGVLLSDLDSLEKMFQVSIFVYELKQDPKNEVITAELVRRSHTSYEPMYLNLYEDHFSYIKDKEHYSKSFSCKKCGKLWKHLGMLNRHELTCEANIQQIFPGGVYNVRDTIFEQLEEEGIEVEEADRYFPFRATFDLEVLFEKCDDSVTNSARVTWEAKHVLVSISVCSNVPGYEEPMCFVSNGCTKTLVVRFLNYLKQLSAVSFALLSEKYGTVLAALNKLIELPGTDDSDPLLVKKKAFVKKLFNQFQSFLKELPVIGFNSGSYDINVMKEQFFPTLLEYEPIKFTIKRNNTFMCLKTENLKFLDICNYLAPGCSYSQFLKAYGCSGAKAFFPYEWLTSVEKLKHEALVPHEFFYSALKKNNITPEEYKYCQEVWDTNKMTSMQDFLIWYNNNDVVPFLEALEKMAQFYKERGLDIFKDGVSVPGLTLKYLFKNIGSTCFTLFDEKNKDLHYTFKQNLIGGPSIIFHRYHEAGKTYIREHEMKANALAPKVCKKIVGYDANALYLWALMQPMPTDWFRRRRNETGFHIELSCPPGASRVSREWLDWEAHTTGVIINHKFNSKETRIGPRRLPVDGYSKETNTVYQFMGCYYHPHVGCSLSKNTSNQALAEMRQKMTHCNVEYIKSLGYGYKEIYECEWNALKKTNSVIQQFVDKNLRFFTDNNRKLTQAQILDGVKSNRLFGAVECDIQVPDALKARFAEMPPLFKHAEVSPSDAGCYMQKFATENQISSKPRKSLIGSMFAKKMLIATPLLKWYLEQGLEVSHIYQVVEFKPEKCFESFGKDVTTARRAGDVDSAMAIIAETMKLFGNSGYGKTITNKLKQRDVRYCSDKTAGREVNSFFFRSLEPVTDDCYELLMSKKKIKHDLPLQIGFFVYQYAKLRMLQFYYDLILKYIDPSDFQYCEMDTDSAYIALSADTLEEVVKPSMKHQFDVEKQEWFPRSDSAEHYAYDKRTPGLFKEEWIGSGIIALCSKTYYCFGAQGTKYSCKGVSRNHSDVCKDKYLDVLTEKVSGQGVNKGFRMHGNSMHTYLQYKDAFTYYYIKRKVSQDGISTTYLDI